MRRAVLVLAGQELMVFDSPVKHAFGFTPSISMFVDCADELEIERLFAGLSEGGEVRMPLDNYGRSLRFGWVNDRFGVSWQLNLPASLTRLHLRKEGAHATCRAHDPFPRRRGCPPADLVTAIISHPGRRQDDADREPAAGRRGDPGGRSSAGAR